MDGDGDAVKLTEERTTTKALLIDEPTCPLDSSSNDNDRNDEPEKHLDAETSENTPHNTERLLDKDTNTEHNNTNSCTNSFIEPFQPLCEDINSSTSKFESESVIDGHQINPLKFKIIRHGSDGGDANLNAKTEAGLEESQEEIKTESDVKEIKNNVVAHVSNS